MARLLSEDLYLSVLAILKGVQIKNDDAGVTWRTTVDATIDELKKIPKPQPDEGLLLTDEEEDRCTPTKKEIEAYLAEPDDTTAKALTEQEKRLVAKCVLYGKKIKQAQLSKAQAHCDKRVREIFSFLAGHIGMRHFGGFEILVSDDEWQAFKSKYLERKGEG
jgi:hypothetical protein